MILRAIPGKVKEFFCFQKPPRLLWGPPSLILNGCCRALFTGVKRPGRGNNPPLPQKWRMTGSVLHFP